MAETSDGVAGQIEWGRGHVRHGRIPEWVLDAEISDRAVRLYVVLGRHADDSGVVRIRKTKLMERLRCARSTLDAAFADLQRIEAVDVFEVRREDGSLASNRYVLHWGAPVTDPPSPDSRVGSSEEPGEGSSGQPGDSRAEQNGVKPFESYEPLEGANAPGGAPDSPPPLVLIEGRNVALDALAEVCGIDPDSRRMSEAAAALAGKKATARKPREPGIRDLAWTEVARRRPDMLADLHIDRSQWEEGLSVMIRRKAALYRERMPGATLTPGALLKWWLDLELARPAGAGLTPEEVMAMGQER